MSASAPAARIEGLNAWRAILMILGVILHAGLWQERQPLFTAIDLCSGAFRMGCFFVISGMLAGFSLRKRRIGAWLWRRFKQIGVPTLVSLALVSPTITLLLRQLPAGVVRQPVVWLDWYHLWFLVALLCFAGMIGIVEAAERRWGLMALLDGRAARAGRRLQLAVLLWMAVLVFVLICATTLAVAAIVPPSHLHGAAQTRFLVGYAPLYLFGYALARAPAFREQMLASARSPLLLLALVIAIYVRAFSVLPAIGLETGQTGEMMIRTLGGALSPGAVAVLILRSAFRMRRVPMLMHRLCDASFTIYLVHLPLIALLANAFNRMRWNPYVEFALTAAITCLLAYGFHVGCVRRWDWLSRLLNGRSPDDLSAPARAERATSRVKPDDRQALHAPSGEPERLKFVPSPGGAGREPVSGSGPLLFPAD